MRTIDAFLDAKHLPADKKELIMTTLGNSAKTENINAVVDGESQLKRVFSKIIDDLGIYYKIGLTTDFTGKLFNEMYGWLGFTQDKLNDVVLTPQCVSNLLVKLARVNQDSYVWDFATGSAGLLVAAMNEMLNDAKEKNSDSPEELALKCAQIKASQLLGLELLPSVYMFVNESGEIDYDFMENFIKATEKIVVEDVVTYADKKIEATKTVIENK